MDPATLTIILVALAKEAPVLFAEVVAILHKAGHITADETATFLVDLQKSSGLSFFPTLPKATA